MFSAVLSLPANAAIKPRSAVISPIASAQRRRYVLARTAAAVMPLATALAMPSAAPVRNVLAPAAKKLLLARRLKAAVITKAVATALKRLAPRLLTSARVATTAAKAVYATRVVPVVNLVAMATRHAAVNANFQL